MRRKLFNMPEAELAAAFPSPENGVQGRLELEKGLCAAYLTPFCKWHMSSDINFASNAVVAQTNKARMMATKKRKEVKEGQVSKAEI